MSQNVELFLLTDFSNVLRSSVRCEVFRLKVLRIKFWGMIDLNVFGTNITDSMT